MKTHRFLLTILVLVFGAVKGLSQDPQQSSNYVVIGAFEKMDNAVRYTNSANQDNFQAQYAINPQRKLYYVFILNTEERKKAFSFLLKIRTETKYKDAWVYMGKLGEITEPEPVKVVEEKKIEPEVIPTVQEIPKKDSVAKEPAITIDSSAFKKPAEVIVEKKTDGKPFYFKLINAASGNEVMGEVQVVESKATRYIGFKGNEIVYLIPPNNPTGIYQITIQAPGYRAVKLSLDYNNPSAVASGTGEKQETILTFQLERAKKGDYIDFNNVRFFKNSTVLEPNSQNELDGLVSLMKENAKYKIKIHGHCNGEEARDIITTGTSTTIFALEPSLNGKENASAKRLTELRAEAVKGYLVGQGIEDGRVSTKGEGGKMMIYPPTSTLANYNDRIEIEVLKSK